MLHAVARSIADGDVDPGGVVVARVASMRGFGSRHGGEAVALDHDGGSVTGRLLGGLADADLAEAVRRGVRGGALEVAVPDPDAEAAGMACGGRALLSLIPGDAVGTEVWRALAEGPGRRPVVIVSRLDDGSTLAAVEDADGLTIHGDDDAIGETLSPIAGQLLRAGRAMAEVRSIGDVEVLVEASLPPTTVRIVGRAEVGDALASQATLLGWRTEVVDGPEDAATAGGSQASHDVLVVLSHDADVDTPALAAALRHGRGYVGALGSRGTQAARRERLGELGLTAAQIDALHGPVGLDLGGRTPAETAVAIVAEVIAFRSGRAARSLASGDGPING